MINPPLLIFSTMLSIVPKKFLFSNDYIIKKSKAKLNIIFLDLEVQLTPANEKLGNLVTQLEQQLPSAQRSNDADNSQPTAPSHNNTSQESTLKQNVKQVDTELPPTTSHTAHHEHAPHLTTEDEDVQ